MSSSPSVYTMIILILSHLQLNVTFSGNSALIGPVAYISQLDFCSWSGLTEPFFDRQNIQKWPFVDADGSNFHLGHRPQDNASHLTYVQTPAVSFNVEKSLYSASPGETIPLQLSGLDELNHATYPVFRIANTSSVSECRANSSISFYVHLYMHTTCGPASCTHLASSCQHAVMLLC